MVPHEKLRFKQMSPAHVTKKRRDNQMEFSRRTTELEKEQGIKNLEEFIETISQELQEDNVPVDSECRIDINAFKTHYAPGTIERDKKRTEQIKSEWQDNDSDEIQTGEKLEMLKTAIFHKHLKQDFIVARSTLRDDFDNGVDNIIMEKSTGNVVCAFDEVADVSGSFYQEKIKKVLDKNIHHDGASLKYGLGLDPKTKKVIPEGLAHIPIFYLALPEGHVNQMVKNFSPSSKSEHETKLFRYFISSLLTQIKALDLKISVLHPELRKKLQVFEQTIKKL